MGLGNLGPAAAGAWSEETRDVAPALALQQQVCMYACIYVYVYIYTTMHVVCMYTCIYVYVYIYTSMHVYTTTMLQ
jgi:hypothetical protein